MNESLHSQDEASNEKPELSKDASRIIHNQNQTIFDLTNELNKKDSILKQLANNQASTSEAATAQLATYKKEIKLLQAKLSMTSSEYDHQLSSQEEAIKSFQSQLKALNDTLCSKDRKLNELLSLVSDYDTQSQSQLKQITQLEKTNKELKRVISDMSLNYEKVSVRLSNKKEEAKCSFNSVYGIQIEKEALEDKAKELVSILKEYSAELSKLKQTNEMLIEQNDVLKGDNEEMVQLNFDLEKRLKACTEESYCLKEENSSLKSQLSQYELMVKTMSSHNQKLQLSNEKMNGLVKRKEVEMSKTENDTQDYSLKMNNDVLAVANWINTDYLRPIDSFVESKEMSKPSFQFETNQSALDFLLKALESLKAKIYEEREVFTNKILGLNRELDKRYKDHLCTETELMEEEDKMAHLEEENDKLREECKSHLHNSKRYQEIIGELNKKSELLSNRKDTVVNEDLIELIAGMIKEVNESKVSGDSKRFASGGMEDRSNVNEMISLLIEQFKEVIAIKKELGNECFRLKNEFKAIEKKYNALVTDIELKRIQIQKQEEIISRRKLSTSNEKEMIRQLQCEKEQLLQDNITLIQQSKQLKGQ